MNILITGGLGFIGTSLTKELINNNNIVILDSELNEDRRITGVESITYYKGDICDHKLMNQIFSAHLFDGIIHLAAVSRVIVAENNPEECIHTNVRGIELLLETVGKHQQNPWFIFSSSREVYGESLNLPVSESDSKDPVNIYGRSKLKGEELFQNYAKQNNLSCAVLRFSNVYGNRYDLKDRVLPRFIRAIYKNEPLQIEGGNQVIDFTHIDDTVHALIQTIEYVSSQKIIDDFHILPGVGWSLQQAVSYLEELMSRKAIVKVNPERNYDVQKFIGNRCKSEKRLKLRPFMNLKAGLALSILEYTYNQTGVEL